MRKVAPMERRPTQFRNRVTEGWEHMRERAGGALTCFRSRSDQAEQGGARWSLMAADAFEEGDHVVVTLEAPGMERDDFNIRMHDDVLRVWGESVRRIPPRRAAAMWPNAHTDTSNVSGRRPPRSWRRGRPQNISAACCASPCRKTNSVSPGGSTSLKAEI